jgi:hypothetical protein
MLERFSSEDRTVKGRIVTANAELKDLKRLMFHDREMRRHLLLEKRDAMAYRKKIAEEVSQVRKQISQTKRRLELGCHIVLFELRRLRDMRKASAAIIGMPASM